MHPRRYTRPPRESVLGSRGGYSYTSLISLERSARLKALPRVAALGAKHGLYTYLHAKSTVGNYKHQL